MFHELDTADNLVAHLDKRAGWDQHKQECIVSLFAIADRCLETLVLVELIPELGTLLHQEAPRACGAHP